MGIFNRKSSSSDPKSNRNDDKITDAKNKILKHLNDYEANANFSEEEIKESETYMKLVNTLDQIKSGGATEDMKYKISVELIRQADLFDESKDTLLEQSKVIYSHLFK